MASTRYPLANTTAQWYADDYPGVTFSRIDKLVIHTTEGSGWPGYSGGRSAPTITAKPDNDRRIVEWRQHFPVTMSARALENRSGGVSTNTANAVQVELVGTCERYSRKGMFWPEAPDWALAEVARFARWLADEHGLSLAVAPLWLPYPSSYGPTKARMSGTAWNAFRGICGHQHVPENSHGDPGSLNAARIVKLATTTNGDDDMPTAKECAEETVKALLGFVPEGQGDGAALNLKTLWKRAYEQAAYNTKLLAALALSEDDQDAALAGLADNVAARVVALLPADDDLTAEDVRTALRSVLREGTGD